MARLNGFVAPITKAARPARAAERSTARSTKEPCMSAMAFSRGARIGPTPRPLVLREAGSSGRLLSLALGLGLVVVAALLR